jgi:hypothetical protein
MSGETTSVRGAVYKVDLKMERITDKEKYVLGTGVEGYLFARPEELKKLSHKERQKLEELANYQPGDNLYLWYRDNSNEDDDFDYFRVFEGEKVYLIRK